MTLTVRQRDIVVSLGVVALGIFFLFQTDRISAFGSDEFGPDLVPRTLAWVLVALGALSVLGTYVLPAENAAERIQLPVRSVFCVAGVSLIGLGYYFLFVWFGYFVATIVTLGVTLFSFGLRKPLHLVIVTVLGAIAYHVVFIRLMHVYDPAGQIYDFSSLLPF